MFAPCKLIPIAFLLLSSCPAATNLMFGVNLAGGEFSIADYPNAADFDYYDSKGLNLIRLPFKWERVQPTLNGALSTTEMTKIDTCINLASARGMKIILD